MLVNNFMEQSMLSKLPVRAAKNSLLGQQVQRALALQEELLRDPLVDLRTARLTLWGCSYATINRYIAEGRLKVFRVGPRGHRRIRLSSLRALLAEAEGEQSQGVQNGAR
jgi:hypothetical protein